MRTTRIEGTLLVALFLFAAGCARNGDRDRGTTSNRVSLEMQLAKLAALGITRNPGTEENDLFLFHTRDELEKTPFRPLAETMGMEIERDPWTPLADALWMCDLERIEDQGDYRSVLLRLERMTGSALGLRNVQDHVDLVDEGVAWVSFEHQGRETRWDLRVDEDWLDPSVLTRYDQLLASSGSNLRLFMASDQAEYGQVVFLAALTARNQREFSELTGIEMVPVE